MPAEVGFVERLDHERADIGPIVARHIERHDLPSPFGQGPLEYKSQSKGFELRSKLVLEGKPITLTVGTP